MTPTASTAKDELIARAAALGFDSCRVAKAEAPRHAGEFRHWLQDGAAGEMQWMERGAEKRCDLQQVLPGARSVIVVALNYWQGDDAAGCNAATQGAAKGKVARYAWGRDYHDLMLAKLEQLSAFLSELGGTQKCYVDTGPVLERDHAAEAGIGWHGKSTMLIDEKLGTWFFLAEILTTLDIPPDAAVKDRCGTCERCMTACPTGAITGPHKLDARRCISYLTIELKGEIPPELHEQIGDRVYGCDICQDVCPWNRKAPPTPHPEFRPRVAYPGAEAISHMDDSSIREAFRETALLRAKPAGLRRNALIYLENES